MRLGVIDIGSNTVHLLVVDAHAGAHPLPAFTHKLDLRLSEHLTPDGLIGDDLAVRLVEFIRECLGIAEDQGVEELLAFATSAMRESPNTVSELSMRSVISETSTNRRMISREILLYWLERNRPVGRSSSSYRR